MAHYNIFSSASCRRYFTRCIQSRLKRTIEAIIDDGPLLIEHDDKNARDVAARRECLLLGEHVPDAGPAVGWNTVFSACHYGEVKLPGLVLQVIDLHVRYRQCRLYSLLNIITNQKTIWDNWNYTNNRDVIARTYI